MDEERSVERIIADHQRWARNEQVGEMWEKLLSCPYVRTCPKCLLYSMHYDGMDIWTCIRDRDKFKLEECPRVLKTWEKILP